MRRRRRRLEATAKACHNASGRSGDLPRGARRSEEGEGGPPSYGGGDDVLRSDDAWRIAYHEFVRRTKGGNERGGGGDSFRHERGPSFPFSMDRPYALSICGGGELNRWRMEVSLDVSNIRYQSTFLAAIQHISRYLSRCYSSSIPFLLCQFRRMRSPCRVIISLRASRPAYSPNYPASSGTPQPLPSLRSIGGGSA